MEALDNMYQIDGIDLWQQFKISIAKGGLDDFLKLPKRKASIEHNWSDEDGLDIDLTRNFYEAKEITVKFYIVCTDEAMYWHNYNAFLTLLKKPSLRRFSIIPFKLDYGVYYVECTSYNKLTKFQNSNLYFCDFTVKFVEQVAGANAVQTFLVNEDNLFIIT